MTPALEEVFERLQQMSPDRQDAYARMVLREILADEQWARSRAQNEEWKQQRQKQSQSDEQPAPPQHANEVVPFS
jgi:hypothetical protein